MRYFTILITLVVFNVYSQDMAQKMMSDFYFVPATMKANSIQSVHVLTEMIIEGNKDEYNYIVAAKSYENDLDKEGRVIYYRSIKTPERTHGLGDKTTLHVKIEYAANGLPAKTCVVSDYRDYCDELKYDNNGNLIQLHSYGKMRSSQTVKFNWKDGKMIHSEVSSDRENSENYTYKYNSEGRLSEYISTNGYRSEHEYQEIGQRFRSISSNFKDDSLTNKTLIEIDTTSKLTTEFFQINGNQDTVTHSIAKYDEHFNLLEIIDIDYTEVIQYEKYGPPPAPVQLNRDENIQLEEPKPEPRVTIYSVENIYANGLLQKRILTASDETGRADDEFHLIQRFIYENEPLKLQSWPNYDDEW